MGDTKTAMERRFCRVEAKKSVSGCEWSVWVNNGSLIIPGLSRIQAAEVVEAIRLAQRLAIEASQREIQTAIGLIG